MRLVIALTAILLTADAANADPWLVMKARADIGKTAAQLGLRRTTLWCAAALAHWTGRDMGDKAMNWAARPRVSPAIGVVAVMRRGKGGHVGIVSGFDPKGNPIIISGNHNRVVGEGVYPRGRIYAWVES